MHLQEQWFHGKMVRSRAENLLKENRHLGDGTFLVRESETFVGDYTLSFWRREKAKHCRIKTKKEGCGEKIKFLLVDTIPFNSLDSLITYYRSHPLISPVSRKLVKLEVEKSRLFKNLAKMLGLRISH